MENYNPVYTPAEPTAAIVEPKKPRFNFGRSDRVFALIFMLLSILSISWGLWGGLHVGYSVAYLLCSVAFSICIFRRGVKRGVFPYICFMLGIMGAFVFAITSNGSVKFWLFVCQFALSAVWLDSLSGRREEKGDLGLIRNILVSTVGLAFPNMPHATAAVFSDNGGRRKWVGKAFIGIACALPVVFIVVPLLISSDSAFEGFIKSVFDNIAASIFKVILGVIITPFVLGYCFGQKYLPKSEAKESRFKGIDNAYIISFLSVISVCYLGYLFSQLAYFFSAFSGFLPEDYTFNVSTYARRGFFELSVIAAINLVIIFAALLLSKKKNGGICAASKILCLFIGIFTLIITATAISKMVLYIKSFGMTVLRLTTSAFMVFLGIVFIAVILRCFIARIKVLRTALITAACVLLVLGIGNVNTVVAHYNVMAYKNGILEEMDVNTIEELGDEGIPYLVTLTRCPNGDVREAAENSLSYAMYDYYNCYFDSEQLDSTIIIGKRTYDGLEQWSLSRGRAYDALERYIESHPQEYIKKSK